MPLTQNYDDDFLSLLATQREILKRLKREKRAASKGDTLVSVQQIGESRTTSTEMSFRHGSYANDSDPFCLMNEPIIERHSRQNESMHMMPSCSGVSSNDFINENEKSRKKEFVPVDLFQMDTMPSGRNVARRNSLCGLIAEALAFDADSTTATRQKTEDYNTKRVENKVILPKEGMKTKKVLDLGNIDSASLRSEFVNFVMAMEKSMKSQQEIHDWDRKMGLKRSHSKTMRLSMRSRNKLRKVVINV